MWRILLIEDNVDTAESMRMLLEKKGYEVRVAPDGPAGIRLAREWFPHAVICDIGLPGMDGYRVAKELQREHNCFFIALTAHGAEEDVRRAFDVGFDFHRTKPCDPDQITDMLAKLLR